MSPEVEITFRGFDASASVEGTIQRWVARLERSYERILRCAVVVEIPHRRHRHGQTFHIRIELGVPSRVIVVSRDPRDPSHEDVYVAVADAFRAARRQLQEHARIQRGGVPVHAVA